MGLLASGAGINCMQINVTILVAGSVTGLLAASAEINCMQIIVIILVAGSVTGLLAAGAGIFLVLVVAIVLLRKRKAPRQPLNTGFVEVDSKGMHNVQLCITHCTM